VSTVAEAVELQRELVLRLKPAPLPAKIALVAATDVSSGNRSPALFGAVTVWSIARGTIIEQVTATRPEEFPYVTGLLAFREIPVLLDCFERLHAVPDVVICDGQGIAHPRGIGLAAHLGLCLNIPAIGCGKTRLIGEYQEVGRTRGSRSELMHKGEQVGWVLRTRDGVAPVFVSPGHLCSCDDAAELVLSLCRYRLPEPIRAAHTLCKGEYLKSLA